MRKMPEKTMGIIEDVSRADIIKLYRIGGRAPLKATAIGAGVGAGSGALIVALTDEGFSPISKSKAALFTAAIGAVIGAIAGLSIGRRGKRSLIYQKQ